MGVAATAGDVEGGGYHGPSGFLEVRGYRQKVASNNCSHDEAVAGRLWGVSEELTGVVYPFAQVTGNAVLSVS